MGPRTTNTRNQTASVLRENQRARAPYSTGSMSKINRFFPVDFPIRCRWPRRGIPFRFSDRRGGDRAKTKHPTGSKQLRRTGSKTSKRRYETTI